MQQERSYQVTCLILMVVILFSVSNKVSAQTANYLTGNKTGDIYNTLLGSGNTGLSSPMQSHNSGFPVSTLQFYYGDTILSLPTSNPTTVTAERTLAGLSGGDAYIQFRNASNTTISSGLTTYFRIGSAPTISGLSVPVGGLLGLSNVYDITGRGYTGASNYSLSGSGSENAGSAAGSTGGTLTEFLIDEDGVWYIGVTPDASYNSVRLNVAFASGLNLLSLDRELDVTVYSAFYYPAPTGTDCGIPIFTTPGETEGVNLNLGSTTSLLAIDSAIKNPQYAIDSDTTTYSRITSGALGIATSVSQTILFNGDGNSSDVVTARLSLPLSALTVGVLSNLTLTAYNDTTQVGTSKSLSDLLSVDLLGLLGDNTPFYVNITPGGQFDRVKISLNNLASIGANILGGGARIYDIKRVTNAPVISGQPTGDTVCAGAPAMFSVTATGDSLSYQWQYFDSPNWINTSTTNSLTINNTPESIDGRKYRVEITGGACPSSQASITSDEATLKVNSLPDTPPIHLGP